MSIKADSGFKFDQGKINQILALVTDLNNSELSILIDKIREEQSKRKEDNQDNLETIQI